MPSAHELRMKRLENLHARFIDASDQYPHLCHFAFRSQDARIREVVDPHCPENEPLWDASDFELSQSLQDQWSSSRQDLLDSFYTRTGIPGDLQSRDVLPLVFGLQGW